MGKRDTLIGLLIALIVAGFSFVASSFPDGLEKVAENKNFIEKTYNAIKSPLADYVFPGVANEKIAGILAGVAGTILVFVMAMGLARLLKAGRK